jgi:hypothetical protein
MEIQISIWNVPSEQFPSQYGFVTFHDWCVAEAKRIGNGAFIKRNTEAYLVCLCRTESNGHLTPALSPGGGEGED